MNTHILKSALISEKSFKEVAASKFTFIVDRKSDKDSIREVIESLFGVNVLSINTENIQGKVKRTKKGLGKRSNFKKAIVTLKKGQMIDLFESEKEEKSGKSKVESGKTAPKKEEKENKEAKVTVRERKK